MKTSISIPIWRDNWVPSTGLLSNLPSEEKQWMRRALLCYNLNTRLFKDIELLLTKISLHDSIGPCEPVDLRDPDTDSQPSAENTADEENTPVPTPDALHPGDSEEQEEEFSWAPFPKIPNVKSFKIKDNGYDELLQMFNLDKKRPRSFEFEPYNNKALVQYAKSMIMKLRGYAAAGEYGKYWRLCIVLARSSRVFQLMALYKAFPRFHRDMSLASVYAILEEITEIVNKNKWSLRYRRVYIPKPNDQWRPLGVPSPVWRVLLALLAFFLVTAYDNMLPSWQHAYRPGRGVMSCWEEILRTVRHRKYIWEFDLKGFFDSVDAWKACVTLEPHLPWKMGRIFIAMSKMAPELPAERKMDEKIADVKNRIRIEEEATAIIDPTVLSEDELFEAVLKLKKARNTIEGVIMTDDEIFDWMIALPSFESLWEPYRIERHMCQHYREAQKAMDDETALGTRGFPQGAAISAFMSVLYLRNIKLPEGVHLTMYADDGLISSDDSFDPEVFISQLHELGLDINPSKCGWVKSDGNWNTVLKFLGLVLYRGEELTSCTRKGAVVKFEMHDVVRTQSLRNLGLSAREAVQTHFSKTKSLIGKVFASVTYAPIQRPESSFRSRSAFQMYQITRMKQRIQDIVGIPASELNEWNEEYRSLHYLSDYDSTLKYFKEALLATRTVVPEGEAQPSYLLEESLRNLKATGADETALLGRVKYLVRTKSAPLIQRVENLLMTGVTWEETLDSRLMGWFLSKMYWKGWTNERVAQDFQLTWKAGTSWIAKRSQGKFKYLRYHRGILLDFANSTSIAFHDIVSMFRVRQRCNIAMQHYKEKKITLTRLNEIRSSLGRPPVKSYFIRHVQVNPADFYSGVSCGLVPASELSQAQNLRSDWVENPPARRGRPPGGVNRPDHKAGRPRVKS